MDFCGYCGAGIPPKEGEGTCAKCDPQVALIEKTAELDKLQRKEGLNANMQPN